MYRPLRCVSFSVLFVLAAGFSCLSAMAAQMEVNGLSSDSPASKASYTVAGTVVNSVTGEPISRALVQLTVNVTTAQRSDSLPLARIQDQYRQRAMLTDHEGRFKFEGLPSMSTSITARKPGFFSPDELNGGQARANRAGAGAEGAQVVLKLVPEAIISGRVTDANGEPLEGATLRISGVQHTNGRRQLQPLLGDQEEPQTWNTNEDGEYRIAALMPGSYYISVAPSSVNRDQAPPMGPPKMAFPVTYYPGVAELGEATPLQLSAGQRAEIDFTIRPAPVIVVAGQITGPAHGPDVDLEFLNQSGDDLSLDRQFDAQTGAFQAHIIAFGPCVIKAETKDALEHPLHAQLTLNATASVNNLRLNLAPALSIPIVVRIETTKPASAPQVQGAEIEEDTKPAPVIRTHAGEVVSRHDAEELLSAYGRLVAGSIPVSVNLHPVEMGRPDLSASVEGGPRNPVLVLRNLEPGRYKVEAIPNNTETNSWYVKSILYGGVDLFREELTVAPGQASTMEIVLRDDSAMLHGTVQSAEDEAPTAAVLVVPEYAPLDPKMTMANDRGEFQIDGLAPGEYKVFAFDRLDGLEYANPQALGEYSAKAAQVSLLPNEKTTVKVDLIQRGE